MVRSAPKLVLSFLLLSLACTTTTLAGWNGNVNFILGQRDFSDDEYAIVDQDSQGAFGVNVDFGADGWPVHMAAGLNVSADSTDYGVFNQDSLTTATADVYFGFLWMPLQQKVVRPYIGGGVNSVAVAVDDDFDDDWDQDFGTYINGGVFFRLGSKFNIGFDARFNRGAEVEVLGVPVSTDYDQYGLVLGFGW